MRLNKYLKEDYTASPQQLEEMQRILQKDCKPFLTEAKKFPHGRFFYHGLKRGLKIYPKNALEDFTVRKDRKPSDIPKSVHNYIGSEIKRKFGWNAREEGVFATSSFMTAAEFGIPYLFFPIGKFKFVYSPNIKDLLGTLEKKDIVEWKMGKFWPVYGELNREEMEITDKNNNDTLTKFIWG